MDGNNAATDGQKTFSVLVNNIPEDVCNWLGERAERNFRSRNGEILAILVAVCRGGATLPGLGVGEMIPGGAK